MKFVVDTTGVAKGFRDYKSAVDGIFASLSKFEAHVDKTMKGVAKASANPQALNAFRKAVSAFAKVDIDTSAARKLSALSAAMQGFKAPSNAQTANTKRFFNALGKSLPDLGNAYRSIKMMSDLKAAMAGFRAPPASASKNLTAFANAMRSAAPAFASLRNVTGTARVANELALLGNAFQQLRVPSASQVTNLGNLALALRSFNFSNLKQSGNFYAALGAISNFRGPTPAQIRNLQNFVTAVANMRVPPNAGAVAAALRQIAEAASRAGGALGGLRAGLGGLGGSLGNLGNQARGASLQMMGLQNAFSGTFQVASVLRSLLGSLTIAELGRNFFEATNAALQFKAQMGVLNKDLSFADAQLTYVRDTANAFGTDMLAAAQGFAKISIAADKSNMSVMQTRHIFEGMSTAMTVLGTTTAGQQDVWLALQQVMNKGYLSAEELNQQLNEKLPGAMAYATEYAESLGLTLEKGLKTKALDAAGVLAHISKRMKEDFGPSVEAALMRPQAQMNILRNNFNSLFMAIGEAGANDAFANLLFKINSYLTPENVQAFANAIGQGLKDAVTELGSAIDWLATNWDYLKGPLATTLELMGKWMIVSSALQIMRFLVSPLVALGATAAGISTVGAALGVLTASSLPAAIAGMSGLSGRALAAATAMLVFRNSVFAGIAATRAAAASNGLLAGSLVALQAATTSAIAGARALVAALGGPLLLTLAAVGYAIYSVVDAYDSHEDTIAKVQSSQETLRKKLAASSNELRIMRGATVETGGGFNYLGIATNMANDAVAEMRRKADEASGGLYSMALNAKNARIEMLKLAQADITKSLASLQTQSTSEVGNLASREWSRGNYGTAIGARIYQGRNLFLDTINQTRSGDISKAIAEQRKLQADTAAQLKEAESVTVEQEMARLRASGFGPRPASSSRPATESSSDSSTNKAEAAANRLKNSVDQIMGTLMEHDPIGKLYQDFVETLDDQAKVLLNNNGYKQFVANVKAQNESGVVSVESLVSVMRKAGTTSADALKLIEGKYGKSSDEIISLLNEQQAALEEAYTDAAIKQLDKSFRSLARGISMVGDSIPTVAEFGANLQAIEGLARFVMPADEGFLAFMTELRSGAISATDALAKLREIMADPAKRSATANQFLSNPEAAASVGDLGDGVARQLRANAEKRRQDELDMEFGGRLLEQRANEIKLLGMSSQEAEAYTTVMEEVNRANRLGIEVNEEKITSLLDQVRAQQALANQMQRNKEFFENNGVRTYINDIKSVGESINDLDKNVLQSLEDQLFSLGTTGKFSFQAIFDTLQQGLIRFASQNIIKEGLGALFGGEQLENGTPSLLGGLFKMMGFEHAAGTTDPLGTSANPMHVIIDPRTGNLFGTGTVTLEQDINNITGQMLTDTTQVGNIIRDQWGKEVKGIGGALGQIANSLMGGTGSSGGGGFWGSLLNIGMSILGGSGGGGGGGGLGSLLGSVNGAMAANPGIFKEGGYPGSPVARASIHPAAFTNAPHYAEGTPNTSGGHPAILHDNEAVIPLSRGRKVPVELAGASRGQVINNNFVVNTPDANSFRKSKQQIATDMHMQAGRAYRRNHG